MKKIPNEKNEDHIKTSTSSEPLENFVRKKYLRNNSSASQGNLLEAAMLEAAMRWRMMYFDLNAVLLSHFLQSFYLQTDVVEQMRLVHKTLKRNYIKRLNKTQKSMNFLWYKKMYIHLSVIHSSFLVFFFLKCQLIRISLKDDIFIEWIPFFLQQELCQKWRYKLKWKMPITAFFIQKWICIFLYQNTPFFNSRLISALKSIFSKNLKLKMYFVYVFHACEYFNDKSTVWLRNDAQVAIDIWRSLKKKWQQFKQFSVRFD